MEKDGFSIHARIQPIYFELNPMQCLMK